MPGTRSSALIRRTGRPSRLRSTARAGTSTAPRPAARGPRGPAVSRRTRLGRGHVVANLAERDGRALRAEDLEDGLGIRPRRPEQDPDAVSAPAPGRRTWSSTVRVPAAATSRATGSSGSRPERTPRARTSWPTVCSRLRLCRLSITRAPGTPVGTSSLRPAAARGSTSRPHRRPGRRLIAGAGPQRPHRRRGRASSRGSDAWAEPAHRSRGPRAPRPGRRCAPGSSGRQRA